MKDNTDHLSKMTEGMLGEVECDIIESVYDLFYDDPYTSVQEQDKDNEDQSTL